MQEIYSTLFIYENILGAGERWSQKVMSYVSVTSQGWLYRMVGRPPLFPSVSLYASSFIYEPFAQFSPTHME